MAAEIRADTRRISTESWAKYFISTDADIKLVTKKLFCIGFFGGVLLFAGFRLIFFFFFTQPSTKFWGGQGKR